MSFGENLLRLRKSKNLSQDELGGQLNVSRQTVSKWELDETTPELQKLISLSDLFKISIDELVKGVDEKPKSQDENDYNNNVNNTKITKQKREKTTRDIIFLCLKVIGITIGGLILIDVVIMIIYFIVKGFPS